jgi:transketolase
MKQLVEDLKMLANQIRRDSLRMVHANNSGHPGGALGCADFFAVMYFSILNHDPSNFTMEGKDQDVFFLSNGHISAAWYSALARSGYFPVKELASFRSISSRLQGHPSVDKALPGIRVASGSLGQGLSVACGVALAKKADNDDKLVYCLCGDGELQEGQIWEAAIFASARKIDNLITFVDYNGQQIDGPVNEISEIAPLKEKWQSFGWIVLETDGNDIDELINTINFAKQERDKGQPIIVLMKTEMGMGVDFMMGSHKWHGVAPNDEQLENALNQIGVQLEDY